VVDALGLFAQLIGAQLALEDRVEQADTALLDANAKLQLRDQFVAVLGHDLRSTLRTISVGSEMLRKRWPDASPPPALLGTIRQACRRMAGLVDDSLDFARGKLGGGIPIHPVPRARLLEDIEEVAEEMRLAHPDVVIKTSLFVPDTVICDVQRLGKLLGNLIGNAMRHGDTTQPVTITADSRAGHLAIAMSNFGRPIPEHMIGRLFQPFTRASGTERTAEGLGLGH